MATAISRPQPDECPDFFHGYIALVAQENDATAALEKQRTTIEAWGRIAPEHASYRQGKDSHIIDAERIFAYRLLRISRGDQTPLPAFDENAYVADAPADRRALADLVDEMKVVGESSIALVRSLDGALANRGTVRAGEISARAAFVLAGHFAHHARLLRERYAVEA